MGMSGRAGGQSASSTVPAGNPKVLAIVPAFNVEKTIGSVVLGTLRNVNEVVVIDDGSTDQTAWIAERAGARVIRHDRNCGYGAALRTGFREARNNGTDLLVVLDGDGQHRPEMIPRILSPIITGEADVCVGSRFLNRESIRKIPRYRRLGIRFLTTLTNLRTRNSEHLRDAQSGFRAYSRAAIDAIDPIEKDMGASAEILWEADKNSLRIVEVPIDADYDVEGSTQGPIRHSLSVIGAMVRYVETEHPLLVFGLSGFVLVMVGLATGTYAVASYFATEKLPTGVALIAVIVSVLGLLLGFTGLILHAVINANRRFR